MRWGKIILLFQAIVTLIIGIAFFSQLTIIGAADVSELTEELMSGKNLSQDPSETLNDIRQRFTIASYLLLIIGLTEIILIIRLLS